jgi:hypothetical protein
MAQAAHPLPSVPPSPAASRLRAAPAPRPARRPSPAVIRRRRALALGGLLALVALPFAWLSISGPSPSAAGQIAALLERGASDPATLCDHLSGAMLAAAGGHAGCVRSSPARGPNASVDSIRVNGDHATAIVRRPDADELVTLVRSGGDWKIDDVR